MESTTTRAHPDSVRGRGALSNASGRFERDARERADDGWGALEQSEALETQVTFEHPRRVLTKNGSPDVPFEQSLNAYRGCEHGCVYCFARPTHAYLGLSPGLDFESRLFAKPEAPILLEREIAKASYRCRVLALGTNTDPYQPIEKRLEITRGVLAVLRRTRHPVSIVTKSNLILRDIDLLADLARDNLVKVALSVTTLDRTLARRMEPRAATPRRRLEAIETLSRAGIPVAVMFAPVIPALNDSEMEKVLERSAQAGAREAGYILLRLPLEISGLFREWLETHYPARARHVMSLMNDMRGGKDYVSRFGERMRGRGVHAELLSGRFEAACRRYGLNERHIGLDTSKFRRAANAPGDQLTLFG